MNNLTESIKNYRCLIFTGLPRARPKGKTHLAVELLAQHDSGIYVAVKHDIVKHAVKIFKRVTDKNYCVWLKGKYRLCRTKKLNCDSCLMQPSAKEDHISRGELLAIVNEMLEKYKVITEEKVLEFETDEHRIKYGGLCPYYCLKLASEKARYVFTVPQLVKEIPPKEIAIIDEEPTIQYFTPTSVVLCEYVSTKRARSVTIKIPDMEYYEQKIKRKHKAPEIRKLIEVLKRWTEILMEFKDGKITEEEMVEKLEEIKLPEIHDPEAVLEKIDELFPGDEDKAYFEPVLFPARKLFYVEAGVGPIKKLYAIADEERVVRKLPDAKKYIFIGGKRVELLCEQVFGEENCQVIVFSDVGWLKNFIVVPVEFRTEDGNGRRRVSRELTRKKLRKLIAYLYRKRLPTIVVTGSKQAQDILIDHLEEEGVIAERCKYHGIEEMRINATTGRPSVIYANSAISRGVDLDDFDVLIMYHCDFTTPYWSAMAEYWKKQGEEEKRKNRRFGFPPDEFYESIRESILADEITNIAFRIAPEISEKQLKVVFMPSYYWSYVLLRLEDIGMDSGEVSKKILYPKIIDDEDDLMIFGKLTWAVLPSAEHNGVEDEIRDMDFYRMEFESGNRIISGRFQRKPPDERILKAIEEERLTEEAPMLFELYKNKQDVDPILYERVKDKVREKEEELRDGCSFTELVEKLKEWSGVKEEAVLKKIVKHLVAEGIIEKKKDGRRTIYRRGKKDG